MYVLLQRSSPTVGIADDLTLLTPAFIMVELVISELVTIKEFV